MRNTVHTGAPGRRALLLASLATGALLSGCYPGTFESTEETDLVATFFSPERDYAVNTQTYAMPEQVYDLMGEDGTVGNDRTKQFDSQILEDIAEGMADLGYRRIADPNSPEADVVVLVGVVVRDNWVVYYPGWGYYPPYWGAGWGYWYYYPVTVNYEVGSIVVSMIRPDERDEEAQRVPVIWTSVMNGYTGSSSSGTSARISRAINQAFEQSEYLRVGDPVSPMSGLPVDDGGALLIDGGAL